MTRACDALRWALDQQLLDFRHGKHGIIGLRYGLKYQGHESMASGIEITSVVMQIPLIDA